MEENEREEYWNSVALEAQDLERTVRLEKWRKAGRNWLADYADKRAKDFVLKIVEQIIRLNNSAKVLDIGCGPGKWAMLYAKKCLSVTAIDISANMIVLAEENAKKRNLQNVSFHLMPASRLSISGDTFDLVNCVTVLQHILDIDDWRKAIHEMVRVTKNSGYILLFEAAPNFVVKKRTTHLAIRTMQQYVDEFKKANATLVYWRAADLSLPLTLFGLRYYAASFNRKVYYFMSRNKLLRPALLSFLSRIVVLLAKQIDYRLAETPLSFLAIERIFLFKKVGGK